MSQGKISVGIKAEDGKVIMIFDRDIAFLELEPNNCLDIAEALSSAAFESREGMKPVGETLKAEIIERHRMTLIQRLSVMLNSTREDKRISNGQLAKSMVDTCIAEIF